MSIEKKPTQVTYGDLVDGDVIVDKSGNQWSLFGIDHGAVTSMWLCPPGTAQRRHWIEKPTSDPVTVLRVESHAAEVERLEADTPLPEPEVEPTEAETVAAMNEHLAAVVVAEETATESDARREAEATGDPVTLPAWAELTHLEQQSHLYLLHGVFAADVKFREKLRELHDEAHASDADRVPHTHVAGAAVPS